MQSKAPLPHTGTPGARPTDRRTTAPLTYEEKRRIFKGMVVAELEAGYLRYSKRQELMRYAHRLGIPEFEATLLMAEAQYHEDEIDPVNFDSMASLSNLARPETWSVSLRLAVAFLAAIFIDVAIIYWLFP
jgi:hypothetical protein